MALPREGFRAVLHLDLHMLTNIFFTCGHTLLAVGYWLYWLNS